MRARTGGNDLTRNTLSVLCIVGLIGASFWILRPFVPALIWATMVVVATWPLMLKAQEKLWRRRWMAVATMTITLLLVFLAPLALALDAIVSNAGTMAGWARDVATLQLPQPPAWLPQIPVVGEKAAATWRDLADSGPKALAQKLAPYAQDVGQWIALKVGDFGLMTVQFLLTVAISAVLYAYGETAAAGLLAFCQRLAGAQGEDVIRLAGQAIRGVALGVVLTAVIQSLLAGIGLAVAGIPLATLLTAVAFMLAVAQIGPTPVLIAAVAWLYWKDDTVWATALLVWSVLVGTIDNVLRPFLIRLGADLPLLLIFAGVIGGLLAFGLVGIFVGPVVLAVAYTLARAWVAQQQRPEAGPEQGLLTSAGPMPPAADQMLEP
jgi:predicted PurR-regulated permease PerM